MLVHTVGPKLHFHTVELQEVSVCFINDSSSLNSLAVTDIQWSIMYDVNMF